MHCECRPYDKRNYYKMAINKKLQKLLEKEKVKYEVQEHRKVFTAFDEAQTSHLKAKEVAKTVLVKLDKNFALVVIPAAKHVDFTKIKKKSKAKKVSLAKENDIIKATGAKIGLVAPFGVLYSLPTYMDNAVAKGKYIIASAGSYTESLQIKPKDFIKLNTPITGSFSK